MDINTKKLKKNAFRITKTRGITASRVRVPGGHLKAEYLGLIQEIADTYGNGFDVENYKGREVVIVAGGTGLSPVKGIVDYFSKNPQDATSTRVIAGFKSPKDMLFKEDMKEWEKNINFTLTVDSAEEGYEGNVGLVTKYIPELKFEDMDTAQVIVVGPPMMMKFTVAEFLKLGMKEENIWISHERKMCCGLGKCGHCRIDDTYVCLDGPVFNYSKGKLLRD